MMKDIDIRYGLHNKFLDNFRNDGSSKIIDELKICAGKSIVDLAVINGSLHAFEIKSERDSLNRLPEQVVSYLKIFDYITIVASKKHLSKIQDIIPESCGLWEVRYEGKEIFKDVIRDSKINTGQDPFSIAQLLWKEEVKQILLEMGYSIKALNKMRKWVMWETIAQSLTVNELSSIVRTSLKRRKDWKHSLFQS